MKILFLTSIYLLLATTLAENIEILTYVIRGLVPSSEDGNSKEETIKNTPDPTNFIVYQFDNETHHLIYNSQDESEIVTVEENIQAIREKVDETFPSLQVGEILSGFYCLKLVINKDVSLPLTKLSRKVNVNGSTIKCVGTPYRGAHWSQSDIDEVILNPVNTNNGTSQLARNLTSFIVDNDDELSLLTSKINQVAQQSTEELGKAQERNETNKILASLDKILLQVRNVTGFEERVLENVAVRIENTNETGGNGIALVGYTEGNSTIKQHSVRSLKCNDTINSFFDINITAAIHLPTSAMQGKYRVAFTAFSNASIFKIHSLRSSVIGVVIDGENNRKLDEPVRLYFRRSQSLSPNPGKCVYWDFDANSKYGNWSEEGCKLHKVHHSSPSTDGSKSEQTCQTENIQNDIVIDEFFCNHLTHFGEFVVDHDVTRECKARDRILDSISLWGSVISLSFMLIYICITIFKHEDLRQRPGQRTKLQLTITSAILLLIFIIATQVYIQSETGRPVLGICTHYFMLCNFTWMFNASILQYRRLVVVFNDTSEKFRLILSLIAWILPILPPAVAYLVGGQEAYSKPPMYLPRGLVFYLTVVMPLGVVMLFNAIIFIRIVISLYSKPEMRVHGGKNKNKSWVRVKQLGFLFFLFGVGWMFALCQIIVKEAFAYIFSYIFVLFISMQGVVYFVLFVLMDKKVKN